MKQIFLVTSIFAIAVSSCGRTAGYKAYSGGTLQMRFVSEEKQPEYNAVPDKQGLSVFVENEILVTSRDLESAQPEFDNLGRPSVRIVFTKSGAERFSEVTSKNIGRKIAVIVDGVCITAPIIQSGISGGEVILTGDFSVEEADALARKIAGR